MGAEGVGCSWGKKHRGKGTAEKSWGFTIVYLREKGVFGFFACSPKLVKDQKLIIRTSEPIRRHESMVPGLY